MNNTKMIENTTKSNQRKAREAATWAYSPRHKTYTDIWSAYGKPSVHKVRAWERCRKMCKDMGGHDLVISAAGCQTFSVCFKFEADGKPAYAYITRDYDRFCYA